MVDKHIFNKETDSEMLTMDIVTFLQKWGMWQDVQIFTGGKCYTDDRGKVAIRNEKHPEKYLVGPTERDCNGGIIWKEFSNPERLLDMTFEGPLSLLLRHHEYEVDMGKVSEEVRRILLPETSEVADDVMFFDDGKIAGMVLNEFDELLAKYGLWYELGFSWSLTAYKI